MSDPSQNPCSPEQQFDTIVAVIARNGYPWVKSAAPYRDDGIKGHYMRKWPGLQNMIRDLELLRVEADLLLVDTLERLGRSDDIPLLRRTLLQKAGVLVVTATRISPTQLA